MKINMHYSKKVFAAFGLTVTLGLTGCSGQQQADEEDLQMSEDDEAEGENLGQDDANEGNGQENYVENEAENEQGGEQQAAEANSEGENFEGTNNGDQLGALDNGAAQAAAPVNNAAPLNDSAGATPMNTSAAGASQAAVAPTDGTSPIPGGRVRYVKEGGVQVVSGPGGSAVLTLNQGEHPVTWEENGMLRLHTGHYVAPESMSDLGVPRPTH